MDCKKYIFESPQIPSGRRQTGYLNHSYADGGTLPYRVVAYERSGAPVSDRPYVTHLEITSNVTEFGTEFYRVAGHYDLTFTEAIEDALNRYKLETGGK